MDSLLAENNTEILSEPELESLLEEKYQQYNTSSFIETDPIQVPHGFATKENIEISAFLTSSIAWGQRKSIIKSANNLIHLMENEPYEFIMSATEADIQHLCDFKHRTFNCTDLFFFVRSLKNIYKNHGGLEQVFTTGYRKGKNMKAALSHFRQIFFSIPYPLRTSKHIADVSKNASAKRLNMFLMWMVRNDKQGIHFGLWKKIPASALMLPLDIHTGNTSRKLGLLTRKQNDWKAVEEITSHLRKFDKTDPVKYDFALFGMGIFEDYRLE